jgi:glycosyltransferase involved in cell wall biosynthesis
MKILVVQDHLRSGGTERQSVLLARGFASAGHDCTLVTFRPGGPLARTLGPLPHRALQPFDARLDWWAPRLVATARRLQPDIVLLMGRNANSHGGRLQAALPGAAVIGTLRTGKRLPWGFRRSLTRVRHLVANSHEARQRLLQAEPLSPDRVSVIHNALVFPPAAGDGSRRASIRQKRGATADTVVVLCVAMFRPEKNQQALLEIVRGLSPNLPWQLWLGGDGPALKNCRQLARQWGLEERVRFLGWVADPTPYYEAADLAALTSRHESLSNFLIEAQAHGLPAVAYDATGVGEAFLPGQSGFLIRLDQADEFRRALDRLVRDPAQRASMAARARDHARSEFAPDSQLQAYLDLFHQLMPPCAP